MIPKKLHQGDHIRVIAPADSLLPKLTTEIIERGVKRLNKLGLTVSFGKHIREVDEFKSTTVENRLEDLHEAFLDHTINGILALSGGTSSNQLLSHIDYNLIKSNPKIICGLSDITALVNAIYVKTGMVTYYGPHFSAIAASKDADYTLAYFKKCLMEEGPIKIMPSDIYYNTPWTEEQSVNSGYWIINGGKAEGTIIGGNFLTLNFIQGTEFAMRSDGGKRLIYILEDNGAESANNVQNQLQSLLLQPNFSSVNGILIGRFRKESKVTRDLLTKIIKTKDELKNVPVIANVDFGHTVPIVTFPIGGSITIDATNNRADVFII
ncbi:S66 family peptidase [Sphingobacterium haloxyli]|uniref:LD-carboxypeptidase n=1 Tax=Sphingobacterium haloxyli TaxID=2100533 RepID=A0A2S9J4T1_9SPHI|nr:S66 peptidase family protein [Sphingobacterium haloxyli]PRD47775.1 LD-carboxypeptidase [Sphingobacterium haloxyli]